MDVEDVHDLFGEENDEDAYGADEAIEDNRYDSVGGGGGGARLELDGGDGAAAAGGEGQAGAEPKPVKRVVKNPMPKLNPDRITGPRGIIQLEKIFADFKPKGSGHEFEDLDKVMKGMEHWAHRMYPKLPFDDVMKRTSVLGKKMTVQCYLKKMRLDMVHEMPEHAKSAEQVFSDEEDQTKRYDEDVDEAFERMMADNEEGDSAAAAAVVVGGSESTPLSPPPSANPAPSTQTPSSMTDEQKERMRRNKELAAERRRQKVLEQTMLSSQQQQTMSDEV